MFILKKKTRRPISNPVIPFEMTLLMISTNSKAVGNDGYFQTSITSLIENSIENKMEHKLGSLVFLIVIEID